MEDNPARPARHKERAREKTIISNIFNSICVNTIYPMCDEIVISLKYVLNPMIMQQSVHMYTVPANSHREITIHATL